MKLKIKKLINKVKNLHDLGAYHVKRGFSLRNSTPFTASNHLIEEASELQAEVVIVNDGIDYSHKKAIEEAADVLLVYLHLLKVSRLDVAEVVEFAHKKLDTNFTLDQSQIKTTTPGFNRSNREDRDHQ